MTDNRPAWIDWFGEGMPLIKPGQTIERRYRDGSESSVTLGFPSLTLRPIVWKHRGDDNDIIAYRVVHEGRDARKILE